MICVNLVDDTTKIKHIEFYAVPAATGRDFKCSPDGTVTLRSAVRISRRLQAGRTFGHVGKYLWYRLIVTPGNDDRGSRPPSLQCRTALAPTPR